MSNAKISFQDSRKKVTVTDLPSFEWASVEMFTSLTVGESRNINNQYKNLKDSESDDSMNATIAMLALLIQKWNFTIDGNDMEITAENIEKFPDADVMHLMGQMENVKKYNAKLEAEAAAEKEKSATLEVDSKDDNSPAMDEEKKNS